MAGAQSQQTADNEYREDRANSPPSHSVACHTTTITIHLCKENYLHGEIDRNRESRL